MPLRSINPTTGKTMAEFPTLSDSEVDAALERAETAFSRHRRTPMRARAEMLTAVAQLLTGDSERWAMLLTEEMGKPIDAAHAEVEKCARVCRYYAQHAAAFLEDRSLEADAGESYVAHLPLGPILAVMPWNFPFWQVFRFAAPALMAGNVVVLKHASNVPSAALALQEIFERADCAPGLFQSLLIGPDAVPRLIEDRRIRAATVTGSMRAGAAVASMAGKQLKKTVLELGGSDAFLVMPSADLDAAVEVGVESRTLNNGQSCIAAKRFIVHEAVYETFVERFADRLGKLVVGDPARHDSDIGPLAMERTRERLERQVDALVGEGANIVCGAKRVERDGFFFEPGLLTDVPTSTPVSDEELFGPVAMVFRVSSLDAAIARANASPYGLGSSVWTRDATEADRAIREIDAGSTFVNSLVRSDPRFPFGGVASSGYGRELSKDGILEFVNRKTVSIETHS